MMRIERTHSFSPEEAKNRLQALTNYWKNKYGVQPEWSGTTLRCKGEVRGIKFDARMTMDGNRISCEADVGWLAEKLGARSYIEKKLDEYLDPKRALADLPTS